MEVGPGNLKDLSLIIQIDHENTDPILKATPLEVSLRALIPAKDTPGMARTDHMNQDHTSQEVVDGHPSAATPTETRFIRELETPVFGPIHPVTHKDRNIPKEAPAAIQDPSKVMNIPPLNIQEVARVLALYLVLAMKGPSDQQGVMTIQTHNIQGGVEALGGAKLPGLCEAMIIHIPITPNKAKPEALFLVLAMKDLLDL